MKLRLEIYRQAAPTQRGAFEVYDVDGLDPAMSILDALDTLNDQLIARGKPAVAFESDCREGICGVCGITVNARPHGPKPNTTACHQRLSSFNDGETVRIEPFRAKSFPVMRDLVVSRDHLDDIIQAGGWTSVDAGTAPDADSVTTTADDSERALDFAACIGCGACVSACPNGSAHLFLGAKLAHMVKLPPGQPEARQRARDMVAIADAQFGPCSLHGECAKVCPAGIPLSAVGAVNRERMAAMRRKKYAS